MRFRRALALAAALVLSALSAPAFASTAPIQLAGAGGGMLYAKGIGSGGVGTFVADPSAHKLFSIFNGTAVAARGTGLTDVTDSDNIPYPTAVAPLASGTVYFLDNPPSLGVVTEGRLRSYNVGFAGNNTNLGAAGLDLLGLSVNPLTAAGFFAANFSALIKRTSDGTNVAGNGSRTGGAPPHASPLNGSIGAPLDTSIDPANDTTVFFSSDISGAPDVVWKLINAGAVGDDITVVAGGGVGPALGDGGLATNAFISNPTGVLALKDGDILVYDAGNERIRRVNAADGKIATIAGNGTLGTATAGTPADQAPLQNDGDLAVNSEGLFVTQGPAALVWRIPAVAITGGPPALTNSTGATFTFASWDDDAAFTCSLDGALYGSCGPLSSLGDGQHTLSVKGKTNNQTLTSTAVSRTWTVDATAPASSGLIAPGDGADGLHVLTAFSWQPTTDSGSGVDHYDLLVDGAVVGTVAASDCTDICSLTPAALGETAHEWQVTAVDKAGNATASAKRSFTVAIPPVAGLVLAPARAIVGRPVTLDASSSTDEGSGIVRYEFDTDGDGTFDTDNGAGKTLVKTYPSPATRTLGVRVTDGIGLSSTTTTQLTVSVTPPVGRLVGISVNDGAQYTNDPNVTLFAVWPSFASDMLVSNDGGFKAPENFPVKEQIPWKLDSSGPERLPKTVYVRYRGGIQTSETFTDDIILDQTPPKVLAAELPPAAVTARASATQLVTLKVKAKDNASGVGKLQVTPNKKKPGKYLKYKKTLKVKPAKILYVRARDRAGNLSTWRTAKRR